MIGHSSRPTERLGYFPWHFVGGVASETYGRILLLYSDRGMIAESAAGTTNRRWQLETRSELVDFPD